MGSGGYLQPNHILFYNCVLLSKNKICVARFTRVCSYCTNNHGRRKESRMGQGLPCILKISTKKGCFLSVEWEKTNFTTFGSLKNFGKITSCPPPFGKNLSDAHTNKAIEFFYHFIVQTILYRVKICSKL